MRIQHVGIDHTFAVPDLGGKRLTLTYAGGDRRPELRLDGELVATGTGTAGGSKNNLTYVVDHPYPQGNGTYADQTSPPYSLESGRTYAIVYGFGGRADALVQKRQRELASNSAQQLPDTSEAILGETLNVMGLTWLKEIFMVDHLLSRLAETVTTWHHTVGLTAQEAGYYIDVKTSQCSITSKHNEPADWQAHFKGHALIASAFEHGMLEQLMGSGSPGISTMKLFQIANTGGGRVYSVNKDNFAQIKPYLSNYSQTDLNSFQSQASNGYTLILPANGQLALGQWKGKGYIAKKSSPSSMSMGMIIGGGYFGGYNSNTGNVSPTQVSGTTATNTISTPGPETVRFYSHSPASAEPVDMASGAYFYDRADLALGGEAPLGLAFTRSYDSGLNLSQGSLGYGWTHNLDMRLSHTSHGDPGLGSRQPVDAVPAIAALHVVLDLMRTRDGVDAWMAASLAAKWAVDQVIDNAVAVHFGKRVMEFIKLPDGSYAPPPGVTTRLVKDSATTFSIEERSGARFEFNAENLIQRITDSDNNVMTFNYSQGKLKKVTDSFGRFLTLGYDGNRISSVADSTGRSVSYAYNSAGNLTSCTDPEGYEWGYGYSAGDHRMVWLKDPLGVVTARNTYNTLGQVATQRAPRQGGALVTYRYYFSGFVNMEKDPAGNFITYYFDEKGRSTGEKDALGNMVTRGYDGQNHLVRVVDARSNSTGYTYDGAHNPIRITNALGRSINNEYSPQYPFKLLTTTDPLGHATRFGYDPGQPYHLVSVTNGEGNEDLISYYANGLVETTTDGRGIVTRLTHDGHGNMKTRQVGSRPVVRTTHDAVGRLAALTDQLGSTTSFVRDARGLVQSKTDPLLKSTDFGYDDAGRTLTRRDRNNRTVSYTRTPTGKVEEVGYPDLSTARFTYDSLDRLQSMEDPLGVTSYVYDKAGRITSVTDAQGFLVSYRYDAAGNLTRLTYPGGKKVDYTYNALNQLRTVTNWLGQKAVLTYDKADRLTELKQFNGAVTSYAYDNADRLTQITHNRSDGTTIASYGFSLLDGNGNIRRIISDEPLAPTFTAGATPYGYNPEGNRLRTAGATTYTHDDEGRLKKLGSTLYTFDYEHRLVSIGGARQFYYDGAGRRIRAVRQGIVTRYIFDASGNLLAEADGAGNLTAYYIYGPGLLAMMTPEDETYCYHFDQVGSTVAMTSGNEQIVNKYAYHPFGKVSRQSQTVPQPFKFVGRHGVMAETADIYHMGARYYHSATGRFISEDPIGFDGGDVNLYAYVLNNPVNSIDPEGLWTVSVGVNIGGMFGAVGGGGGTALNIGYSESEGFSTSLTGTVGGGAVTGVGVGVGISIAATDARSVDQLLGTSVEGSRGFGAVTATGIAGNGYKGGALTFGIGGKSILPSKGAGILSNTSAIAQWEQSRGFSFLKAGK